ncbi:MAG: NAD(P)/FAD-dependent oxidoreductase [Lachnospiraceae bacterium]|nr:NAD(P)/FAD-dependent oxidoreductase [Lachnospiraceae bacterium]
MYDVVIVGGGVSGTSTARELSRYDLHVCVVEKMPDVCYGTSKANSGIVHAGYDCTPGTLMAKLNVRGNRMMPKLAKDLDVPFMQCGSLVVCTEEDDRETLTKLYEQGVENGVEGLEILDKDEVRKKEKNIADGVIATLWAPTAGIVCPFTLNYAYAEVAAGNGVEFRFNTEVQDILKKEEGYCLITNLGKIETKVVVNAAGVYSDRMHNMVSDHKIHITARRGEYCLLDRNASDLVNSTIFQLPGKMGKGVLVSKTAHGNILLGPTAVDQHYKEGTMTSAEGLETVLNLVNRSVKNVPRRQIITSFAGLRAHEAGHEFIIGEVEGAPGFVDCAGIESPGLASSPAIGEMVAGIVTDILHPAEKEEYTMSRKGILNPMTLSVADRNALIGENPAYGNIVCRCEMITEGEIIDAIKRPLGATTLDGIKRRTRAGMGRCQSGFCMPKIMEIMQRELSMTPFEITKCGKGSEWIVGTNKDKINVQAGGNAHAGI